MGMYDRDWYKDGSRGPTWFSEMNPYAKVFVIISAIALFVLVYFHFSNRNRARSALPDIEAMEAALARQRQRMAQAPVHTAAEEGDVGRVAELIAADLSLVQSVRSKEAPDQPLHIAASSGQRQVADLLLRYEADVNARGDQGFTPLHYAADSGHVAVVELLLKRGANPQAKDAGGNTPLQIAERNQNPECAKVAELLRKRVAKP